MLGRNHPLLKRIRALRRDTDLRRSEGVVLVEGVRVVETALAARAALEVAVVSDRLDVSERGRRLRRGLEGACIRVEIASDAVLDAAQDARSPQPVVALARWRPADGPGLIENSAADCLVLAAVGIQDPGNLGTLIRTADAAGVSWFAAAGAGVDPAHPRTVRATAGSLFRLPVTRWDDPVSLVRALRGRKVRTLASAAGAGTPYPRVDWTRPTALFVGGEGSGLPAEVAAALDGRVTIPMRAGVESLSVGAAAAVLLFEAARQRLGAVDVSDPSPRDG